MTIMVRLRLLYSDLSLLVASKALAGRGRQASYTVRAGYNRNSLQVVKDHSKTLRLTVS